MRRFFVRRTSGITRTAIIIVVITDNHEPSIILLEIFFF